MQMLAREVIYNSILPFLTQDTPDADVHGELISQRVSSGTPMICERLDLRVYILLCNTKCDTKLF